MAAYTIRGSAPSAKRAFCDFYDKKFGLFEGSICHPAKVTRREETKDCC